MNANQEIIAELRRVLGERDQARRERDQEREACAMYAERSGRFAEQADKLQADLEDARSIIEDLNDEITRGREAIRIYRTETEALKAERDEWRDKFLALNQTAGEICNACGWAFKIPGEECRCEVVKERDDCQKQLDEVKEELRALTVEHADESTLCDNALGHLDRVTRERDEARAEVERLRAEAAPTNEHFNAGYRDGARDAYRRGAEAMREHCIGMACAQDLDPDAQDRMEERLRALPIPEET